MNLFRSSTTPIPTYSMNRSPLRRVFLLIPLLLAYFALSPLAQAQLSPPPDGGYPNGNTAEGDFTMTAGTAGLDNSAFGFAALNINQGSYNTGIGAGALFLNSGGNFNTATGFAALYSNVGSDNTATGFDALNFNTFGGDNTADGFMALFKNTIGTDNTAVGSQTLLNNTEGSDNTGIGSAPLFNNTTGNNNTAVGFQALISNTEGSDNTAIGSVPLFFNTTGSFNTAVGFEALSGNGDGNTAVGNIALEGNTTGSDNTAVGSAALDNNTMGNGNTAFGEGALFSNTTGSRNIALGFTAGHALGTGGPGDDNIEIGNAGGGFDTGTIRIGDQAIQGACFIAGITGVDEGSPTAVFINATTGQLGTTPPSSSRRFKKEIKPMDKTSEAILAFKPVTFRYKNDDKGTPQFGLVAEDVAEVNPDLVMRDNNGEVYTVRYDAVNAMLLNEFLKEHRAVQELKSTVALQQKRMEALAATVQQQAAQIQKVSAQVEASRPAPQVAENNQ